MFGLNEPIRAVADRYAGLGYAALVPNLFWRSQIPDALSYDNDQHPAAWERLKAIDLDVVSADMRVAVEWLRAQPFSARQGRSDRLLRRRAICVSRGRPLRRRRCGVALRARDLANTSARSATPGVRCNCTTVCRTSISRGRKSTRCPSGRARLAGGRGVPLSAGRAFFRQSGAADLRRRGDEARRRAHRADAGKIGRPVASASAAARTTSSRSANSSASAPVRPACPLTAAEASSRRNRSGSRRT